MEFPDLGKHCAERSCHQLDFLPLKCDACEQVFCKNHMRYDDHNCHSAYKKDVQVPVCPLCGKPVPVPRGETPDIKVGEHIDRDCQSDPAKKKRKAYANRCSVSKCKQHELMPVICPNCRQNFCLRHRHQQDHDCKGFQGSGRAVSSAGAAAMQRAKQTTSKTHRSSKTVSNPPQQTMLHGLGRDLDMQRRSRQQNMAHSLQNNMSEDEALARALQLSQQEAKPMTQEEKDLALARQLQAEEEEQRRRRRQQQNSNQSSSSGSSCHVS
uniref:AN1-type zinc finger protein 2A n=1 Tax=Phallusia mammillata TaxID=59560 RepID=A0A6F9DWW8_9ASCI|nr:AN1-type zinc finger protein 2A [Phallusia mammillata]